MRKSLAAPVNTINGLPIHSLVTLSKGGLDFRAPSNRFATPSRCFAKERALMSCRPHFCLQLRYMSTIDPVSVFFNMRKSYAAFKSTDRAKRRVQTGNKLESGPDMGKDFWGASCRVPSCLLSFHSAISFLQTSIFASAGSDVDSEEFPGSCCSRSPRPLLSDFSSSPSFFGGPSTSGLFSDSYRKSSSRINVRSRRGGRTVNLCTFEFCTLTDF